MATKSGLLSHKIGRSLKSGETSCGSRIPVGGQGGADSLGGGDADPRRGHFLAETCENERIGWGLAPAAPSGSANGNISEQLLVHRNCSLT